MKKNKIPFLFYIIAMPFYIIYFLFKGIYLFIKFLIEKIKERKRTKKEEVIIIEENQKYIKKSLLTDCENYFFEIIKENFSKKFLVQSQVPLSSIVDKIENTYYKNELYRTIDIGIFDKQTKLPVLMIEIDDKTHQQAKRKYRDYKVKEILNDANIKLIKFYTDKSNTPQYIVDRIGRELKN